MGEASGIKKNKVRPGIQSEENVISDQVVSSEEMNLEPFECLEEQHSGEVHLQRPRDGHTCVAESPDSGEVSVARAVTKTQRGERGERGGQGPDHGPCWPRDDRGFPSLPGEKSLEGSAHLACSD